jgi:hypothetical protein
MGGQMKIFLIASALTYLSPMNGHAATTCHGSENPVLSGAHAVSIIQKDCKRGDTIVLQELPPTCGGARCIADPTITILCNPNRPRHSRGFIVTCRYRGP